MKNYLEKFSLKEKVVFVVGGAGLLGAEISRAVASAGGKVVILDIDRKKGRKLEREIQNAGYTTAYEYFDISDLEKTEDTIVQLQSKYKSIDVWINVAYPKTKDWVRPLEKMNLVYLRKNVDMLLTSCIWSSRKVAMVMRKSKTKGSIINLGSIYGVQANDLTVYEGTSMTGEIIYCAAKAGIINATRYLASHFGRYGIRANTICPGGIFNNQNETFVQNYNKKVPLKRMGRPEDVAAVVLSLASGVSSYINGATIMVDGGWTAV